MRPILLIVVTAYIAVAIWLAAPARWSYINWSMMVRVTVLAPAAYLLAPMALALYLNRSRLLFWLTLTLLLVSAAWSLLFLWTLNHWPEMLSE